MIISKLIISNGIRFKLVGGTIITYTPGDINVITGGNGKGKSSLIEYLHPGMIPPSSDFNEGYRELHILNGTDTYVLTNHKIKKNAHSITKNGLELNIGYGRVGYSSTIDTILEEIDSNLTLGRRTFSDASPATRGEWLSKASNVDYTYALSFYKKLAARLRDYKGSTKLLQPEVDELVKDLDGVNEATIQKNDLRINQLKRKLGELLPHTITRPIEDIEGKLKVLETERDSLVALNLVSPYGEIDRLTKEHELLMELITNSGNKITTTEHKKIVDKYSSLINEYEYPFELKDINNILNNISSDVLVKHCSILDELYGKHDFDETRMRLRKLTEDKNIITNRLNKASVELGILDRNSKSDEVGCPKCKHKFIPNFDSFKLSRLRENITVLQQEYDKTIESYDSAIKDNEEASLCNNTIHAYSSLLQNINYDLGRVLTPSRNSTDELNSLMVNLRKFSELYSLSEKVNSETTEVNIGELNKQLTENSVKLSTLKSVASKVKRLESIETEITLLRSRLDTYYRDREYNNVALKNKEECNILKGELLNIETMNETNKSKLNIIEVKRDNLNLQLSQIETLEKLTEGLSPKNGLIAQSLISFINGVVNMVNNRIRNIWSYKMEILPPSIEDGELTYKFPVNINDEVTPKDIKMCSSGQREVIDLAFLLTIREINGDNIPIYLDEFGRTLDKIHQPKVLDFVTSMNNGQVFMITHSHQVQSAAGSNGGITICDLNKCSDVFNF